MEKLFKLKQNGTTVRTEIVAGLTTFMTMAYIIALNPNLLTNFGAEGASLWNGVFLATCIASAIGMFVMAFAANKPFAMAPGMGLNSFFAIVVANIVSLTGVSYVESFQAGLSWECILNKREAFRQAFDSFDLEKVCGYGEEKLDRLQQDPAIVRNKLKICAAVNNAGIFRTIQQEWGSFDRYLWHWTEGQVIYETGKVNSELSDAISRNLKQRGMKFVGTIIIYSYLQAVGVINSHEEACFCRQEKRREL